MNILKSFFNISTWQTLVILIALVVTFVAMFIFIKKYKLKFHYRVLIGLIVGLLFGLIISGSANFPGKEVIYNKDDYRWGSYEYGYEVNQWFSMISKLFINGLMVLMLPVLFLAMARIVSKQTKSSIAGITWKGVTLLLINVGVAFTVTFWLGNIMNIGDGFHIDNNVENKREPMKSLSQIVISYMPSNFFKDLSKIVIVPVLVLGGLVGLAIRRLNKKHPEAMAKSRENLDRYWKICMSVLMYVIKFMPYAILTMISSAMFSRPIGEFKSIGELIGLGYLGLIIAYGWHVLTVYLFGISPKQFIKKGSKPLLNGFLTQSSMAVLPMAMETLKEDMKLKKSSAPDVVMPLSTTIGLTGCAGVQSGVILTLLYNASNSPVDMNIGIFFLVGFIVTIFVSLGIAGIPGTSTIVTIGVISTMGFSAFVGGVLKVISPLNGIFDMGRTAVNVNGGLQASLIAASLEDELPDEIKIKGPLTPLLKILHSRKQKRAKKKEKIKS